MMLTNYYTHQSGIWRRHMSKRKFAKTHLATSLSLILGVSISTPIFAQEQDEQETEIIEVTGIRGSLQEAASIKRYSAGIVDAISEISRLL